MRDSTMILFRTFISSFLVFILLAVSVGTLEAAKRKEYCDVDPDFRQLILEMSEHPALASSLKKDPNLAETWLELEKYPNLTGEDNKPINTNPDILKEFIKVPTVKTGNFQEWFDTLTYEQAAQLWKSKDIAKAISTQLRHPGKMHEWCMVCRAPTFKKWSVTVRDIWDFRTKIDEITWTVPGEWVTEDTTAGHGTHDGNGAVRFHLLLKDIIDESTSIAEFNTKLQKLVKDWDVKPSLLPLL